MGTCCGNGGNTPRQQDYPIGVVYMGKTPVHLMGLSTGRDYGYRQKGDVFSIMASDYKLTPLLFKEV